jgi:peptidoglycan/xylan/chitin deacetylase (PgdA/CDA1 family)
LSDNACVASGSLVDGGVQDRIPVLIYHGFYRQEDEISEVPSAERRYSLPVAQFAQHVERLASLHYSVCSVEKASGSRAVAFTFDDGHISNYTCVWPILVERGFTGTFFIVADWVGGANRIDAFQLREMSSSGMSIGSHGLTHTGLAGLPEAVMDRELRVSKERLEQLLGTEVATLALPRGLMDRRVLERARVAGYRRICTSNAGLMRGGFAVPRLSVTSFTGVDVIEGYARRDALLIGRTRAAQAARLGVKRLIGVRNYETLCRKVLGTP